MSDQTPPTGDDPAESPASPPSYGAPTPPPAPDGPPAYPSYPSYPDEPAAGDGGAGYSPPPPYTPGYGGAAPDGGAPLPYSVGDAWSAGFRLFRQHAGPFVLMALTILITSGIFAGLSFATSDHTTSTSDSSVHLAVNYTPASIIFNLLASIVGTLLTAAMIRGALDAVDGKQVTYGAMFEGWDKIQVLIAAVITRLIIAVGLILCIVPGIIAMFLLYFTNMSLVDRNLPAFEAVKASAEFARAHVGPLLLTALVAILTNIVGACLCLVGLLVSMPVTVIMAAVAFRILQGRPIATAQ